MHRIISDFEVTMKAFRYSLFGLSGLWMLVVAGPAGSHEVGQGSPSSIPAKQVVAWNNHVYYIQIENEDTGGAVGAVVTDFPFGEAPPRHVHHDAVELFHVLDGTIELEIDGVRTRLGPGETTFVKKG
ncbi:MAG: cupin domain-containing protein [Alphaproteobacteria bacterium]